MREIAPSRRHASVEAVRTVRGDLARSAGALLVAAALTLALGMIYPVQFVIDTAGYRETSSRSVGPVPGFTDPELVSEALGGAAAALESLVLTEVVANGRAIDNVMLSVMRDTSRTLELSMMPESTRVAGAHRADRVDISADIANVLKVSPGSTVAVRVGPEEPLELTVGGVYATREFGSRGLARVDSSLLDGKVDPIALVPTQVRTDTTPEALEGAMAIDPWRSGLDAEGYSSPFRASSTIEDLRFAERESRASLGLILAIGVVALLALLGVVATEIAGIMRAFRTRGAVLVTLGVSPRGAAIPVAAATTAISALALTAGGALGRFAYIGGWVAPAFPGSLELLWWSAVGAAALVAVLVSAIWCRVLIRGFSR